MDGFFDDLDPIITETNFDDELMDVSSITTEVKPLPLPEEQ